MNKRTFSVLISVAGFITFIYLKLSKSKTSDSQACYYDFSQNQTICSLLCPNGTFALPGMKKCQQWLSCDTKIKLISTLSASVVKTVYLVEWNGHEIVLSALTSEKYEHDFHQNLFMLKALSGSDHVVPLIGFCNDYILTKYYPLGNALNIHSLFRNELLQFDTAKLRLKLCIDYVSTIGFLHSSPVGVRVMCDSSSLEKTLSQFLLTGDMRLVVNDLDATPQVMAPRHGVLCGSRPLVGQFVAPEQLWPYEGEDFDVRRMPPYDEKTDIWKIPDVCNWILSGNTDADVLKYKLFNLHRSCKNIEPSLRPTAHEVIDAYRKLYDEIV